MANNRMVLVCNVCAPKFNDWDYTDEGRKKIFVLGKWYPGNGGYGGKSFEELPEFIDRHEHNNNEMPLRLEYECPIREEEIIKKIVEEL